jgi:uncharacterized protein (DUF342 family)
MVADGWSISEEEISRFLREQNEKFAVSKGYRFAEQRDAQVEIQLSSDRLSAWVTLRPPLGGKKVSGDMITGALQQAGLKYGVLKDKIADLVDAEVCDSILIAKGVRQKLEKLATKLEDLLEFIDTTVGRDASGSKKKRAHSMTIERAGLIPDGNKNAVDAILAEHLAGGK